MFMPQLLNFIKRLWRILILSTIVIVFGNYLLHETILPFYGETKKVEINKITGGTRGEFIHYLVICNGKEYHGSSLAGGYAIGDSIFIEYWPTFPHINRICRGQTSPHHSFDKYMFYLRKIESI